MHVPVTVRCARRAALCLGLALLSLVLAAWSRADGPQQKLAAEGSARSAPVLVKTAPAAEAPRPLGPLIFILAVGAFFLTLFVLAFRSSMRGSRSSGPGISSVVFLLSLSALDAGAAMPALPPSPTHYVTDKAAILSAEERGALEARLAGFEDETSNQFLVYIEQKVPEGTTLEEYAAAAFKAWGVGQREKKNGLVLFVFPESRVARFEVGYGLEGTLPDALAGRILQEEILTAFKDGNYSAGIEAGVTAAITATKGEFRGKGP
ncbi:MAG: TPM domain-containing protein, partial [Thermoanaerobaculia bacterium]